MSTVRFLAPLVLQVVGILALLFAAWLPLLPGRSGMATASPLLLRLLLRGGKRLPVVRETDDLVTSNNVDVQVWFPIPIAIFERQRNRHKV